MKTILWSTLLLLATAPSLSGCVVHETVRPGPPCRHAVWISGGYGPRGRWHPGHWHCGRVIVVE